MARSNELFRRLTPIMLAACRQEYDLVAPSIDAEDLLPCGFTPIPSTALSAYDCNPVFTGTDEPWSTGVGSVAFRAQPLLGHPLYQLWYTSENGPLGEWALGYAISTNGVDWTPHPDNPVVVSAGGWDATRMDQLSVVWDPRRSDYVLTYQGYSLEGPDPSFGIGVLTSPDGVRWTSPVGRYPAVDLSLVQNGRDYCWPLSTRFEDGGYQMTLAGHEIGDQVCQIYAFDATDIAGSFRIDADLVLPVGPLAYDAAGMASASAVRVDDTDFLFYVGFEGWQTVQDRVVTPVNYHLALATSADGEGWRKDPDNPLPFEGRAVSHVAAERVGARVQLWVTERDETTGKNVVSTYLFDPARHRTGLTDAR